MANPDDDKDKAPQGLSWGASAGERAQESGESSSGNTSRGSDNKDAGNKDVMGVFGGDVPAAAQQGDSIDSKDAGRVSAPPRGSFLPRSNAIDNLFAGANAAPEPALRSEHSTMAVLGSWATPEPSVAQALPQPAPADVAGAFGAKSSATKSSATKSSATNSAGLGGTMLGVSPPPTMSAPPTVAGLAAPTAMGAVPSKAPPGLLMDAPAALGTSAAPQQMGETLGGFGGLLPDMPDIALPSLDTDDNLGGGTELAPPEPELEPLALPEPQPAGVNLELNADGLPSVPPLELHSQDLSPPTDGGDDDLDVLNEPKRSSKLNVTLMGGGPEQEELAELRQQIEQEKRKREEEADAPAKSKKPRFGVGKGAKPAMPPEVPQGALAPSASRSRRFFFVRATVLGALAGLLGAGLWMEFSKGSDVPPNPPIPAKPAAASNAKPAAAPVNAAVAAAPAQVAPAKPPVIAEAVPSVVAAPQAVPAQAPAVAEAAPAQAPAVAQAAPANEVAPPIQPKVIPIARTVERAAPKPATAGKSPAQIITLAERLLRGGDAAGAEAMLRPLAAERPRDHHVMEPLAKALISLGNGRDAVGFAKLAVKRRAKRASYRILLGDAHRAAGDDAAAASAYREALKLDPKNDKATRRLR